MADPHEWVVVASCGSRGEATAVSTMLDSEGIVSRIEDHDRSGISTFATWMVGFPAVVLVCEADAERAREALTATTDVDLEAEALAAPHVDNLYVPSGELSPSGRVSWVRFLLVGAGLLAALALLAMVMGTS